MGNKKRRVLLVDEAVHFVLAASVGVICWLVFDNPWLILVALLFGFLIDVDHFFDYFAHFGFKFNLKDFFNTDSYMKNSSKIFVPLHGWEYVLIFWLVSRLFGVPGLEWTITLAYSLHLFWDNYSFSCHPFFYFFTFRVVNQFNQKKLVVQKT